MLAALKFDITAQDRFAASFGKLKGELGGVKGALAGVNDYARRTGKSMRTIGRNLSIGVTAPLTFLGKQSVQLYDTQVQAENAVAQAITSTGSAAGRTLPQLKGLASALQDATTFGDEDILRNVTAPLLTFTKVQGDVFDRAQANVLDMSTLLKMDLKSASLLVGKALNDPIKGLSALSRSGIQFSEDQKKVIKSMVETGDVAGAQALILKELETQFGGQAAKAAEAPLGQWRQLSNAIGDVKEELGAQIVPFLKPVVESVKEGVKWFAALDPKVKSNIVKFGGIAAAAGPLAAGIGVLALGVAGLGSAFALLTSPITLVLGAVALVGLGIYQAAQNWDAWKEKFPILQKAADLADTIAQKWRDLPSIKWALLIPALRWAKFVPLLRWATFVPRLAWAGLAGVLKWGALIGRLSWAALGVITPIGWAALAGTLAWSVLVKKIEWSGWIPRVVWADWLTKINWLDWIPSVDWNRVFGGGASAAEAAAAAAEQHGRDISAGLALGVQQNKGLAGKAGQDIAEYLEDVTKEELGIHSPSRVFMEIGQNVMAGFGLGLSENRNLALDEMVALSADLQAEGGKSMGMLTDLRQGAKQVFTSVLTGAQDLRSAVGSVLSGFGNKLLGSAVDSLFGAIWPSADGNVFSGGRLVPFAAGGVVDSPTMFPMRGGTGLMGEAGPEAIMPLTRGSDGKLGVRAQGGGGGDHVQVNFAPVIDARGADQAAVARLEAVVAQQAAGLEASVQKILRQGNNRRINRAWSGA